MTITVGAVQRATADAARSNSTFKCPLPVTTTVPTNRVLGPNRFTRPSWTAGPIPVTRISQGTQYLVSFMEGVFLKAKCKLLQFKLRERIWERESKVEMACHPITKSRK